VGVDQSGGARLSVGRASARDVPAAACRGGPIVGRDREMPGLHACFRVVASTGAGCSHVCALRWTALDLDYNTVRVARDVAEGPKCGVQIVPTKNGKRNRVEVDDATMDEVGRHRDEPQTAAAAGFALVRNAYVFAHEVERSSPWRPNWEIKIFIRLRGTTACVVIAFRQRAAR